jgi:cytoskeletal protein RodZ
VSDDGELQLDACTSPGTLLRAAREARELSQREVADRLHLMPGYPALIERDEFSALRHPAFARGYVRAYGKLVGVDEKILLEAFDRLQATAARPQPEVARSRPPQLQRTGLGMVIGLALLVLLVVAVWWWRATPEMPAGASQAPPGEDLTGQLDHSYSMTGEL